MIEWRWIRQRWHLAIAAFCIMTGFTAPFLLTQMTHYLQANRIVFAGAICLDKGRKILPGRYEPAP